ncbi:8-oxoguanine glycosylase ogg1, partial [Spiromyces aspiralis]
MGPANDSNSSHQDRGAWHDLHVPPYELRLFPTLVCGQAFRWRAVGPDEWACSLWDVVVRLRQTDTTVLFRAHGHVDSAGVAQHLSEPDLRSCLRDYFQLDTSLASLYADWSERDSHFKTKVSNSQYLGLRLMRQDPIENLFTFICTSNNHIARITKMVNSLCTEFGRRVILDSETESQLGGPFYTFPDIKSLASATVDHRLRSLGFGYRAKYIHRTAMKLVDDHPGVDPALWLHSLRDVDYFQAKGCLMQLCG